MLSLGRMDTSITGIHRPAHNKKKKWYTPLGKKDWKTNISFRRKRLLKMSFPFSLKQVTTLQQTICTLLWNGELKLQYF